MKNIGSVENSSFRQLENIQLYGLYSVGVQANGYQCQRIQLDIRDVIHLSIATDDVSLVKMEYNLDELRDLESRLILVTSCDAKDRKNVDLFLHVR